MVVEVYFDSIACTYMHFTKSIKLRCSAYNSNKMNELRYNDYYHSDDGNNDDGCTVLKTIQASK